MPPNEEAGDQILAKRAMDRKLLEALEQSVNQRIQFEVAVTRELGELNTNLKLIHQRLDETAKWMDNTNKVIWGDPTKLGADGLIASAHRNAQGIVDCGKHHAEAVIQLTKDLNSELSKMKIIWGSIMFFGGAMWTWLIHKFKGA